MRAPAWLLLVGVAGIALGWFARGPGARAAAPASPVAATSPVRDAPPVVASYRGLTADEMRAILDEALAPADAPSVAVAPAPAPARTPPLARDPGAVALIDERIADGVWDDDDRDAFQRALPTLAGPDAHAAVTRLSVAINDGAVEVTADQPF